MQGKLQHQGQVESLETCALVVNSLFKNCHTERSRSGSRSLSIIFDGVNFDLGIGD